MTTPPPKYIVTTLTVAILVATMQLPVSAAQWRNLARTELHDVALDDASVRQSTSGKMTACLKFTPFGVLQRKRAAAEYGKKDYHLHLEYYEIDCEDKVAVLRLTDIMESSGKRVGRLRGEGLAETIIPGSAIDKAAERICPVIEEKSENTDEDPGEAFNTPLAMDSSENRMNLVVQHHIDEIKRFAETNPTNHAAWVELGNAYYDSDMHKQAIEAYDHALVLKPDDADVLNDQGAMYRQSGNIKQALKNFEKAFAIAPYNLESLYNMGYIFAFDLNQTDQALKIWQSYLKLDHSSDTSRQVQSFIERYSR